MVFRVILATHKITLYIEGNTKEISFNHKRTRMVKDGEDWLVLRTQNLKNLDENCQDVKTVMLLF